MRGKEAGQGEGRQRGRSVKEKVEPLVPISLSRAKEEPPTDIDVGESRENCLEAPKHQ